MVSGRGARWVLLLAVLAGPLRAIEPKVLLTPFVIYTSFAKQPSGSVRSAIQDEIHSIIEPIGWKPEWLALDDSSPTGSASMAIVRFKGSCDIDDLNQYPAYKSLVLGQTYTVDGAIIPVTDVYCSAIRAKLAEALVQTEPMRRELVFGRAVARVLAHELYHILAREKHHASGGLAESHFTSEELVSATFRFRPKTVEKLRRNLVPVLLAAYGWIGQTAWERGPGIFVSSGCSGCHGFAGEGTSWGPILRLGGKGFSRAQLLFRLGDPGTEMYHKAAQMNLLWPSLRPDEIRVLFDYLSGLSADSGILAAH